MNRARGLTPVPGRICGRICSNFEPTQAITIVITSHILEEAEHCDRLAILDKGTLVALGTPEKLNVRLAGK